MAEGAFKTGEMARPFPATRQVKIALLGFGTVGSGVMKTLAENGISIREKINADIQVKKILVRDTSKPRGLQVDPGLLTTDPAEILNDPEIQIVVEVMGGISPARELILRALEVGKSVVTANKEVVAEYGQELFQAAESHGVEIDFEASVAGGIPVVRPLKRCLAANKIHSIIAILNGTTNYILTQMDESGAAFEDVLAEAQRRGYAESDPTADIEGHDAARKLAILASIAFGTTVRPHQVFTEGISRVTPWDVQYAREMGQVIKLLAIAREVDGELELRVTPAMIRRDHPLASVKDAFNAVLVSGTPVGHTMFYGLGAGSGPTASAVLGDVVDIVRGGSRGVNGAIYCTCYRTLPVREQMGMTCRFYLRLKLKDRPGVLARVAKVFGDHDVSLHTVLQKRAGGEPGEGQWAEIVLVTHPSLERNISRVLDGMRDLDVVFGIETVIRLEDAVD